MIPIKLYLLFFFWFLGFIFLWKIPALKKGKSTLMESKSTTQTRQPSTDDQDIHIGAHLSSPLARLENLSIPAFPQTGMLGAVDIESVTP